MSSLRQIDANRRNARLSTGPITEEGKRKSRRNAVRHGLTAETVIDALEDAKDYAAFEASVTVDFDAQSAVERELVLRLASVLWRLRRATAIETGLFNEQVDQLHQRRSGSQTRRNQQPTISVLHGEIAGVVDGQSVRNETYDEVEIDGSSYAVAKELPDELTHAFIGLSNLPACPLDRLSRYEATLWRQACRILFTLRFLDHRRPWKRFRRGSSGRLL
jgi:hypothetical protein